MKSLKLLILTLSIAFSATSLSAQSYTDNSCSDCCLYVRDPYINFTSGIVFPMRNSHSKANSNHVIFSPTIPGTSLFSLPDSSWHNKYETGYEFGAAVGCSLACNFRAETEFLYQNFRREISGSYDWEELDTATLDIFAQQLNNPLHRSSSQDNVYCLLTNYYYDFTYCDPWSFSIGGGFGISWLQSNSSERDNVLHIQTTTPPLDITSPTHETSTSLYGTAFAWQLKTTVNYKFYNNFIASLGYRLFGTTRFNTNGGKIVTNPGTNAAATFKFPKDQISGLLNSSVNLTITYLF